MLERPRRLRRTASMRELVADVTYRAADFMLPIFVREGLDSPREIKGMPRVLQHTEESFLAVLDDAIDSGIVSVMLFAVPAHRDSRGSAACEPEGILNRVVRAARSHVGDKLVIVADLCLDEFTDHGHCGVLDSSGEIDNDATLEIYGQMGLSLAAAGADLLGTSGMMDGQVASIRRALDEGGFSDVGILAYAAKFASNFYGPFRDAVESQLDGDRKTYQQDFRRSRESLDEIALDVQQGADIVMVKPAMAYLDVVARAAGLTNKPIAAYLVSGEYAMVEAAAQAGVLDRSAAIREMIFALKRAGANIICTYWALELALDLKENS